MDAITAMLSGDTLTDEDKMKQTADALRGSQRAGDFFAMSSLAPLQQLGQAQGKRVLEAAKAGGIRREAALRRAQAKAAADNALKLSAEQRLEDRRWQQEDQEAKFKNALDVARIKASKGAGSSVKNMPAAQQKGYTAAKKILADFPGLIERVGKNDGAFGLDDNPTAMLPGFTPNIISKPLKAWEASTLSDDEEQVKTEVFKNAYEIIHDLAGATLGPGEEDKLIQFLPVREDSVKTIQNKLRAAYAEAQKAVNNLDTLYGGGVQQQPPQGVSTATSAPQGMTSEQQRYWGELTPQQQAEYLKLKREAGR